jgi:glyoxylase-like metal-dependent hydrolase (beta-lactamase superfamily II)
MSVRLHHILTGSAESNYATSVFGAPERHPLITKEELLPFGYKERKYHEDGTFEPGIMVPVPVWFIEGEDSNILIDTGLGDCDELSRLHAQYGQNYVAKQTKEQEMVNALAAKGLKPEDIDIVVLTHLHFDHIGNNELFKNARFIVQKDEIPLILNPPKFAPFYYREWQHKITSISDRLEIIEGNYRLSKNIELIKLGGHTPGQMVIMAKTQAGKVCLASDFIYNYSNLRHGWPMGPLWNLQEWITGYQYIKGHADIIVPNHDFEFFEYFPDGIVG